MGRKPACVLIVLWLVLFTTLARAQDGGFDATTSANVNLRGGPGTGYGVVALLHTGQMIHLAGRSDASYWWVYVSTADGLTGWVYRAYVDAAPELINALPVLSVAVDVPVLQPLPDASAPGPAPSSGSYAFISGISGNARAIFQRGQQLGNRANVFAKVGDSITVGPRFLSPIAWGAYNLRDYGGLQPAVSFFAAAGARTANSFANESIAAGLGWTSATILDPGHAIPGLCLGGETPLACEYRVNMPAVALIMIGTNDVSAVPLGVYRANLATIAQISIDHGVIPVFSTISTRVGFEGGIPGYNQAIVDTARGFGVPLSDYASAIAGLERGGVSTDGVHPSYPPGNYGEDYGASVDFTPDNLRYGYAVLNLLSLQALDAVWRQAMN